jgi:heat-inducible transcriptional repressor
MTAAPFNKTVRPKPDSRRQAVLATVIESYLISGEPVGSHIISDRFARASGWGSATIRNVMSELEEIGLLEQPHTSAGRIPTDQGYRYYVDNMLDSTQLSENDLSAIESISSGKEMTARPDRLMERASHVLSELSEKWGSWFAVAARRQEAKADSFCEAAEHSHPGRVGLDSTVFDKLITLT